jgi:hypothetical protein
VKKNEKVSLDIIVGTFFGEFITDFVKIMIYY